MSSCRRWCSKRRFSSTGERFRYELPLTLTLAFAGVAIAATIVAVGMHWIVGWSWIGAALFGVLIAATDPVSVIAAFREMRLRPRVSMVVEAESLLNDGVAAVGFAVLSVVAAGASPGPAAIVPAFLWTLGGGRRDRPWGQREHPDDRRPYRRPAG